MSTLNTASAAIPILRDNNGQEPEVMSEDDEYVNTLSCYFVKLMVHSFHEISDLMSGEPAAQLVQDIFGFGLQDGNRPGGGPLLVPRGHRPIGMPPTPPPVLKTDTLLFRKLRAAFRTTERFVGRRHHASTAYGLEIRHWSHSRQHHACH